MYEASIIIMIKRSNNRVLERGPIMRYLSRFLAQIISKGESVRELLHQMKGLVGSCFLHLHLLRISLRNSYKVRKIFPTLKVYPGIIP